MKPPMPIHLTQKLKHLTDLEIQPMPRKGTIQIAQKSQVLFLRPLVLIVKKDSDYRPLINLKKS